MSLEGKMKSRLYVGNLPFDVETIDLEELFAKNGLVKSINIIKERGSGRGKGFGFVEMGDQQEAREAIENINNKEFQGRVLNVDLARNENKEIAMSIGREELR